jgi:iron complex outermembrane recepter protein
MLSATSPVDGKLSANLTLNFLIGLSADIAGNRDGIVWDIRYSHKTAHAYQNKYDGFVSNSGFKENNMG